MSGNKDRKQSSGINAASNTLCDALCSIVVVPVVTSSIKIFYGKS